MRTWIVALALGLVSLSVSVVDAADKVQLGVVTLEEKTDRDTILLPACTTPKNVQVTAVKVEVKRFPAEINRLQVTFHNGESLKLTPNIHVKAGTTSAWIDLPGKARCIQKIVIVGDTDTKKKAPKKKAEVIFYGRVAPAAPVAVASGGSKLGVVRLAETTDRDLIQLPKCKNSSNTKITSMRFTVEEYPAEINHLSVEFQNGERTQLQVKDHFAAGSASRWMDMPGEKRCVAKIFVVGDTDTAKKAPKRQAKITFYGK